MVRLAIIISVGILLVVAHSQCSKDLVVLPDATSSTFSPSNVLLVSTLNGSLHAVDRNEGRLLWTVNDLPRIRVSSAQIGGQLFVTDPRNGGLYVINGERVITKFPKSIPELVNESPQRTQDGILITGKKTASWIAVDPKTGSSYDYQPESLTTCPLPADATIFIPRTEYVLSLLDSTRQHLWNATFHHYGPQSAQRPSDTLSDTVLTAAASGELLKISADRQTVSWYHKYQSPVVGVFSLGADGALKEVSHHVVEAGVMKRFIQSANTPGSVKKLLPEVLQSLQMPISQQSVEKMLFVGQHGTSTYALPTLLEKRPGSVQENFLPLIEFIEVSSNRVGNLPVPPPVNVCEKEDNCTAENKPVPEKMPTTAVIERTELQCVAPLADAESSSRNGVPPVEDISSLQARLLASLKGYHPMPQTSPTGPFSGIDNSPIIEPLPSFSFFSFLPVLTSGFTVALVVMFSLVLVTVIVWLIYKGLERRLSLVEKSMGSSQGESTPTKIETVTQLTSGFVVGKIEFDPSQLLGRGCDGTCVFRGKFDGRPVAVKRLLPDCFSFADREVALLKESDFHHNVIRYFCTEADSQFRYIALELCQANLTDYVEKRAQRFADLNPKHLLQQAVRGISHLHKLNIVHRDIKPHNVLLSFPDNHGHVRVLISDFGLCKKLSHERMSFSKVSGMLGTQGWIAPEMLDGSAHPTRAIDIFSAGCMFYYCITEGHHPFGDNGFSRQANIVNGHCDMKELGENMHDDLISRHLISSMISTQPEKRPSADAVLIHPFFWDHARQLAFLQDVSDRVEKEDINSAIVNYLEENAAAIVRWNWRTHIGEELQDDLKKFRHYRGGSVRDLLRALRNKKHHYRELPDSVRFSLGDIPTGFIEYFTSRFPRLLLHIYLAVQLCKAESQLATYYCAEMDWPPMEHAVDRPWRKHETPDPIISRSNIPSAVGEDIKSL